VLAPACACKSDASRNRALKRLARRGGQILTDSPDPGPDPAPAHSERGPPVSNAAAGMTGSELAACTCQPKPRFHAARRRPY
jgi:hypothetical protein